MNFKLNDQEGLSPVFVLFTAVAMLSLTGFTIKYVNDSQKEIDDEIFYQEDLVAKNNVEIIKKDAAREKQGGEDKTADWQTYRNEEWGIEFKYPADWSYHVNNYDNKQLVCLNPDGITGDCLASLANNRNINLQERYESRKKSFEKHYMVSESVVDVDGVKGKLLTVKDTPGYSKSLIFEKNGNVYEFEMDIRYESLFNPMLSTFKFDAAKKQGGEAAGGCTQFFAKPTGQGEKISLPLECKIAIGNGFSDWRINIPAGQKSDQRFEFEVRDENGNFIQKIPVGDIDYSSATVITGTSSDDINFAYDINFDGYLDLRVLKFLAASNIIYDYWIFDPLEKRFEQDPILTDVSNADFDSGKRTINAYSASGPDPANWTVYKYELVDGFFKKTIVQ